MPFEWMATALSVLHFLAAALVTLHVLLTHEDVRSSIGWIGLAWLSPFVGSTVYLAFGVNRTARHGAQLKSGFTVRELAYTAEHVLDADLPTNIQILERANAAVTGLPVFGGNKMDLLIDGNQTYPAMLDAIEQAEQSIALSTYILASDTIGFEFADALIRAHERGVEVRVLADGIGSGYLWSPVCRHMKERGVPVGMFLHEWLPWKMTFINLRNHKKILVVDGKTGFSGGMNISDKNVDGDRPLRVQDIHARFEGPIVEQLMQTFERDWTFTTGERLEADCWWPDLSDSGAVEMRGITSGPDEHMGSIETVWSAAIERAERRIRIVTPYFLPEIRVLRLLNRAAERGVDVEVIVPERSNHFYFDWAMDAHLPALNLDRVKCLLTPGPFDHSKLMSVDGHWSALGSANWDARSMRLNFEFLLECFDQGATSEIDKVIDQKVSDARRLSADALERRPVLIKIRDACARLFLPYL